MNAATDMLEGECLSSNRAHNTRKRPKSQGKGRVKIERLVGEFELLIPYIEY
jgi:hypothetical protein